MISSKDLPRKCQKCSKSTAPSVHNDCIFCQDLDILEEVLCYLNQCIQDPEEFRCHAFQPALRLVKSAGDKTSNLNAMPRQPLKIDLVTKFLHSDRIKYKKALALQNLNNDPDDVFVDIKYHFVWNVAKRLPVFKPSSHITSFVHGKLMEYSEKVGCLVDLLWLAPDHVHLYVNSDGKDSVETLAQGIKRFSRDPLIHELTRLEVEADPKRDLWDEAYFSETIG